MSGMTRVYNTLAVASNLLLIILLLAWLSWLLPPPDALKVPSLLLLVLPLLVPLRGLLHGRRYTHAWTSLLAVLYFVHGVAAAGTTGPSRTLGLLEILLSLGLFIGCAMYSRATGSNAASKA